jgi:hypothetical protein
MIPKGMGPGRVRVYLAAVNSNQCINSIAKSLGITEQCAREHIKGLRADEYIVIKNIQDKTKFYQRGKNCAVLEAFIEQNKSLYCGYTTPSNAQSVPTPCATPQPPRLVKAHDVALRGFVSRYGDLDRLKVRGELRGFLHHVKDGFKGADQWDGRLKMDDGQEYTLRFQESEKESWLYIWLHDYKFTPEELAAHPDDMTDLLGLVYGVFQFIMKWGGWEIGFPELYKEAHYVAENPDLDAVLSVLPVGTRMKADGVWMDESHEGKVETDKKALAQKLVGFVLNDTDIFKDELAKLNLENMDARNISQLALKAILRITDIVSDHEKFIQSMAAGAMPKEVPKKDAPGYGREIV